MIKKKKKYKMLYVEADIMNMIELSTLQIVWDGGKVAWNSPKRYPGWKQKAKGKGNAQT